MGSLNPTQAIELIMSYIDDGLPSMAQEVLVENFIIKTVKVDNASTSLLPHHIKNAGKKTLTYKRG